MSRAQDIIDLMEKKKVLPKIDGQDNNTHDKYHNQDMPHNHKPGG